MSATLARGLVLACSAVLGCTGAIPAPLELGAPVQVGGWLAIRTSSGELSLLQRVDDQDGQARFQAAGGEASGALSLSDAKELSVWALEPDQVVLFDPQGVRRAPRPDELELVAPDAALGACACPIPTLGGVVRLLSGASCPLPPTDARTHRWTGEAWEQSDGAPEAVVLHVGGERCLPSPEEMIANAFTRVEVVETIELPDDPERVGGYQAFEILDDGSFYVMGQFAGLEVRAGVTLTPRPYEVETEGRAAAPWPIRATMRVRGSGVIGVVGTVEEGRLDAGVRRFRAGLAGGDGIEVPVLVFTSNEPGFSEKLKRALRLASLGPSAAFLALSGPGGAELGAFPTADLTLPAKPLPSLRAGSAFSCGPLVWGSSERPCWEGEECPGSDPAAPRRAFVLDNGWAEAFETQEGPAWPSSWWSAPLSCVRPDLVVEWTRSSTSTLEGADLWRLADADSHQGPRWEIAGSFAFNRSSCGGRVARAYAAPWSEGFFLLLEDGRLLAPDGGCAATLNIEGSLVSWRSSAPEGAPWFLDSGGRLLRLAGTLSSESPP